MRSLPLPLGFAACAALTALAWGACVTSAATQRDATRARLEQLSSALARAGMSVPVPPRVCDEPERGAAVAFDDDVGCVSVPPDANPDDALRVYARAIVARRVPDAPPERADLLATAFLEGDPAFASMAQAIEREFDARRLALKTRAKPAARPRARLLVDGGPAHEGPLVDGGPAPRADGRLVDGGPAPRAPSPRAPVDGGTAVTTKERLVGTWVTVKDTPVLQLHTLCASGDWIVRYEAGTDVGRAVADELDPLRGTWEVTEGDPPTIALILADGERQEGSITSLTDDAAEVAIEGEVDPMKLARRSKSANCE